MNLKGQLNPKTIWIRLQSWLSKVKPQSLPDGLAVAGLAVAVLSMVAGVYSVRVAQVTLAEARKSGKEQSEINKAESSALRDINAQTRATLDAMKGEADVLNDMRVALRNQEIASKTASLVLKEQLQLQRYESSRQPDLHLDVNCSSPGSQQSAAVPWSKLKMAMPPSANIDLLLKTDQTAPTLTLPVVGGESKVSCSLSLKNVGNKEALDVALYSFPLAYTKSNKVHTIGGDYDPRVINLEPSIGAATGMNLSVVPRYDLTNRPIVLSFSVTPGESVTNLLFLVNLSGTNIPAHMGYLRIHFTR